MNLPERLVRNEIDTLTTVLFDILDDAPHIDYDQSLSWDGEYISLRFFSPFLIPSLIEWALPDQLVYSTVSAILSIYSIYPDRVDQAVDAILRFITQVVQKLASASREYSRSPSVSIEN